jgi:hypothetical protein
MKGDASSTRLVTTMSGTAMRSRGRVPTQYFTQKSPARPGGRAQEPRILPSRRHRGKTKRAAIAATTKPASPRFRNETTLMRRKETCSPV